MFCHSHQYIAILTTFLLLLFGKGKLYAQDVVKPLRLGCRMAPESVYRATCHFSLKKHFMRSRVFKYKLYNDPKRLLLSSSVERFLDLESSVIM